MFVSVLYLCGTEIGTSARPVILLGLDNSGSSLVVGCGLCTIRNTREVVLGPSGCMVSQGAWCPCDHLIKVVSATFLYCGANPIFCVMSVLWVVL